MIDLPYSLCHDSAKTCQKSVCTWFKLLLLAGPFQEIIGAHHIFIWKSRRRHGGACEWVWLVSDRSASSRERIKNCVRLFRNNFFARTFCRTCENDCSRTDGMAEGKKNSRTDTTRCEGKSTSEQPPNLSTRFLCKRLKSCRNCAHYLARTGVELAVVSSLSGFVRLSDSRECAKRKRRELSSRGAM